MALESIFATFGGNDRFIGGVPVDIITSETYDLSNTVTEHPIERGGVITDHVYKNPVVITMTGVISKSPISIFDAISNGITDRHIEGYQQLERLHNNQQPFTLVTGLKVYQNMVLQALNAGIDVQEGEAVMFTATLKQIEIANTFTVPLNEENVNSDFQNIATSTRDLGRRPLGVFSG